jgi:MoaA/NifB/PqqE/SkfB family radical SAM enzyme
VGPARDSILQIHPTRRCNLRCLHCYSSSGPEQRDQLEGAVFEDAITDASVEGYRVASFSGGEPTLYKDLPRLLRHSRVCGMSTTVTSNGMLLSERLLEGLAGVTSVLAISLDGIPESHNRMRGSPRAFETMAERLPAVRASGIPFGFIFTLTQYNLDEMEWAAGFAFREGAGLFQIHPLEEVGRAAQVLEGARPDELESAYAYLEAERIRQEYAGRMVVQFDLIHASLLRDHPDRFFDDQDAMARPLGELVSPLVIEDDGRVVPFGYGFSGRHALGSLRQARLSDLAAKWRADGYRDLQALCRATFEDAAQERELPILNWWEKLGERANVSEMNAPKLPVLQS